MQFSDFLSRSLFLRTWAKQTYETWVMNSLLSTRSCFPSTFTISFCVRIPDIAAPQPKNTSSAVPRNSAIRALAKGSLFSFSSLTPMISPTFFPILEFLRVKGQTGLHKFTSRSSVLANGWAWLQICRGADVSNLKPQLRRQNLKFWIRVSLTIWRVSRVGCGGLMRYNAASKAKLNAELKPKTSLCRCTSVLQNWSL